MSSTGRHSSRLRRRFSSSGPVVTFAIFSRVRLFTLLVDMACTKYLLLLIIVLAAYTAANANPVQPEEVDFEAIARKFQEDAQRQFEEFKKRSEAGLPPFPQLDVKSLPKDENTHVYGKSESSYHVASNINGKKTEESGGHKIINDDGKITEYDTA